MAKTGFASVDDYISKQPAAARPILTRLRNTIRRAVPRGEEGIAYQIPAYKLNGRAFLYFAGWARHFSLYPANRELVAAFRKELAPYEVNDKGTIRFPLTEPVPAGLIARIARFRAREVAGAALDAASKPSGKAGTVRGRGGQSSRKRPHPRAIKH